MLEKDIEKDVKKYARSKGWLAYKFTSPGHMGVCDAIMIYEGRVIFVEFKQLGEKPTPLQSRHHLTLAKNGATVFVVDSVDLGKDIIDYETEKGTIRHHGSAIRYFGSDQ